MSGEQAQKLKVGDWIKLNYPHAHEFSYMCGVVNGKHYRIRATDSGIGGSTLYLLEGITSTAQTIPEVLWSSQWFDEADRFIAYMAELDNDEHTTRELGEDTLPAGSGSNLE